MQRCLLSVPSPVGTGSGATLAPTTIHQGFRPFLDLLPDSRNDAYLPLPGSTDDTVPDDLDALFNDYWLNNPDGIQAFTPLIANLPGLGIPAANAAAPDHTFMNDPLPRVSHNRTTVLAEQDATPFVCIHPGCSRTKPFTRKGDLDRHMKSHSPPEFGCPIHGCKRQGDDGFPRKDKLRDHMRQKHRMGLSDIETLLAF